MVPRQGRGAFVSRFREPAALDGDAIIAAQALEEDATIVTTNPKHFLALGAKACEWSTVPSS